MSNTDKEKILFVVNPISGGKSKKGFNELVTKNLNLSKYNPEISYTEKAEHACDITRKGLNDGFKKIIAVGGDGTVNEVAKMVMHTDVALGIIPFGSGNGLARHMGIPINPAKAIEHLTSASIKLNDAGIINDKPFFCTSGIGFDAHIGKIFAELKGRGFSGYAKAVLREFAAYQAQSYAVEINGEKFTRNAFLITFANATQYGNNAHIAPKAQTNDGLLDICILKPFPVYAMPALTLRVFNKSADKSKYMESYKTKEIKVIRQQEGPIHLDGEPFELGKEISVSIVPNCLKIIA